MHAEHADRTWAIASPRLPGQHSAVSAVNVHAGLRPICVFCVHPFCICVDSFLRRCTPHGFHTKSQRDYVLQVLRNEAVWFERVTGCLGPKDDKYLELALAADAEIIVSSDDDLLMLHPWRGVRILRPAGHLTLS
jgi:hypothetical protein